jgi:hypothetical protein
MNWAYKLDFHRTARQSKPTPPVHEIGIGEIGIGDIGIAGNGGTLHEW